VSAGISYGRFGESQCLCLQRYVGPVHTVTENEDAVYQSTRRNIPAQFQVSVLALVTTIRSQAHSNQGVNRLTCCEQLFSVLSWIL
jgi:hypothetical protein